MDALGNNTRARQYTQILTSDATSARPWATHNTYQAGTGRLTVGATRYEDETVTPTPQEWHAYDVAGNRTVFTKTHYQSYPEHYYGVENNQSFQVEQSRSYYGADGTLRIVDRRACAYASATVNGTIQCQPPASDARPTFEEHRYDALGRRVLTRTDQTFACSANCIDGVTRTVWDGDQVLYEIRRPIADPETDAGIVASGTAFAHQYGRVGYTHGGGIDKPLAIYRMDYDTFFPGVQIVAPHTDARGSYEAGTHAVTGIGTPCRTVPYQVADAIAYPSNDPENPPPPHADSVQVCVKVDYPAAKQWMTYKPRNTSQAGAYAWWGSLITGGRDASGQMYMRNRYYDPSSGRFTQEDPIGIAGGLNLYGFANGDPVNFSDPYGLATCNPSLLFFEDCPLAILRATAEAAWTAINTVTAVFGGRELGEAVTGIDSQTGGRLTAGERTGSGALGVAVLAVDLSGAGGAADNVARPVVSRISADRGLVRAAEELAGTLNRQQPMRSRHNCVPGS